MLIDTSHMLAMNGGGGLTHSRTKDSQLVCDRWVDSQGSGFVVISGLCVWPQNSFGIATERVPAGYRPSGTVAISCCSWNAQLSRVENSIVGTLDSSGVIRTNMYAGGINTGTAYVSATYPIGA